METLLHPPSDPPLTNPNLASEDGDLDPQTRLLESISATEGWNPLPGSPTRQAPITPLVDDGAEGQTFGAQLVEAGVDAAEAKQLELASTDTPPDE